VRLEHQVAGSVVDFVAEETVRASETTAVGGDELHESYVRWYREKGRAAVDREAFAAEFDQLRELPALRGSIRKFGTRYFGIALAATQRLRLVRRRAGNDTCRMRPERFASLSSPTSCAPND